MPKSVGAPTVKLDHVRSPPGYVTLMLRPFLMRSAGIVPVHAVVEYGSPSIADPALSSPYVPGICEGGLSAISTSSEPRSSFVTCIDTAEDSASEPSSNIVSASRLPTRCRSMSPYRDSPAVSHVRAGAGKTCDCASSSVTWADPPTHPSRTPRTAPRMTLVGMEVDIVRIALCRDARTRSAKVLEGAGGAADHATSRDDLLDSATHGNDRTRHSVCRFHGGVLFLFVVRRIFRRHTQKP